MSRVPWQLGRLFFALYGDDSSISNVRMLKKKRLELCRWYYLSISASAKEDAQAYLPWKP